MNTIAIHTGGRIKLFRKRKNLTLEDLALKINKSKATVYKYETGAIALDIQTLWEIAEALEVDVSALMDFKSERTKTKPLPRNLYFNQSEIYMYYYDGRVRRLVRALLALSLTFPESDGDAGVIKATLYNNIPTFDDYEKCAHLYVGTLHPHDTVTYLLLENQANSAERIYLSVLNPFRHEATAIGLLSGISTNPFSPIATKVVISKYPIVDESALLDKLKFTKEDMKNTKYYNMFMIQQSN